MTQFDYLTGQEVTDEELPAGFNLSLFCQKRPGLAPGPICERCGNTAHFGVHHCYRCGTTCSYCRHCLQMGKISSCTTLHHVSSSFIPFPQSGVLHWSGRLSDGQKQASKAVQQAIAAHTEHTVWAVAGAGKTEVLFHGIAAALQAGQRVCIAAPRADVVRELAPRLAAAFPDTPPVALYGGTLDRHRFSPLVVATTHQLLRFRDAFDVMVVDEVDAFPYTFDPSLQFAVQKARKTPSALIYLTATPEPAWKEAIQAGRRSATIIPARYHRQALPVPRMVWCGNWKKALLPSPVASWLAGRQKALLFYPHIDLMQKALPLVQQIDPQAESVYAADPLRKEKVAAMRSGDVRTLLTTTILERGVTFPAVDVAVIGAEDRLFTESALVQIAGRAGRSKEAPTGDVVFFHYGKTRAMQQAVRQIRSMNRLGIEQGLIDE